MVIKRVISYFSKPIFLSTILCIFIFYSGLFLKNEYAISKRFSVISLIKAENINQISGILLTSPVKSSSGKTYSSKIQIIQVGDHNNNQSSASGIINILIPTNLVEAHFPGKLYTAATKGAFIYEAGGIYTFSGTNNSDYFTVSKCTSCFWKKNITGKIDYFRAICRLQFKRLMYSWKDGGGLLLALLSGAREYTDDLIKTAFKNAGLSHILALSGMHLSMFSSIAVFIGNRLKNKKISYGLKIITLVSFVWFAGFSPSLLRAFICNVLLLLTALANYEKPDMILILCFSFLLQSIISPGDITNLGFMLSYGALFGILIFNRLFLIIYDRILPKSLSVSFASSTSAQIFTAPISLNFFGAFCPIGIIATSVVSPIITVFIYSGLVLIILSLIFPFLAGVSGNFVNFLYTIIKFIVLFFSKAPRIEI